MYSTTHSRIARNFRSGAVTRVACALALACATMFASGCAILSDNLDRAAKGAGKVVTYYCENITVPEIREEVRAAVNKHATPHSVAINCVDGGPTLDSTTVPTALKWSPSIIFERVLRPIFFPESESYANG